ncbi:hypothetical protein lbkm_1569 [Lachnospiraceae bacterium KM106-2]|nr:hypothetical protein lbkm_1569 [Lachnospiraceae bacterium KM106-2]
MKSMKIQILLTVIIIGIGVLIVFYWYQGSRKMTFGEITKGKIGEITYMREVKSGTGTAHASGGEIKDVSFLKSYEKHTYQKRLSYFSGKIVQPVWYFYNDKDELLFKMAKLTKKNQLRIDIQNEETYYQW